jgi:hypothetical protein
MIAYSTARSQFDDKAGTLVIACMTTARAPATFAPFGQFPTAGELFSVVVLWFRHSNLRIINIRRTDNMAQNLTLSVDDLSHTITVDDLKAPARNAIRMAP